MQCIFIVRIRFLSLRYENQLLSYIDITWKHLQAEKIGQTLNWQYSLKKQMRKLKENANTHTFVHAQDCKQTHNKCENKGKKKIAK